MALLLAFTSTLDESSVLSSRGIPLRLKALGAAEKMLDVSLEVPSLEIPLTRRVLRRNRLDTTEDTDALERTDGVRPDLTQDCDELFEN